MTIYSDIQRVLGVFYASACYSRRMELSTTGLNISLYAKIIYDITNIAKQQYLS